MTTITVSRKDRNVIDRSLRVADSVANYASKFSGGAEQYTTFLRFVLIRNPALGFEPAGEDIFAAAMAGVMKAFADHRLNPDLFYELSSLGSGDHQVLRISWQSRN